VAVAVVASVGYVLTSQALERVSDEREQAEAARRQAEAERTRTKAESERAEANLRLATRAFEEIFSKVAADPVTPPLGQEDDEEWPEPVWEETVTGKDAAMLESMLKFYDQFAQQNQADVKLQRETARAYRRVGDIQQRLGQYDKAETAYRHALATYERLSASTATSGDYLTALAAIHNELGAVLLHTGRFLEARNSHLQAQETLRRQSPEAAAAPESRFELARTYSFLSVAMPGFRRGGGQRSPGGWRTPGPPGQTSEAAENNRRALEILQKLTEEAPDNRPYRLAMARSQRDRYLILAYGGRAEEAHQARQEAVRILEQLIVDAPNNPDYPYELAQTYSMPYRRPRDAKVPESRVEELRRAVELGTELVARYPTVPDYRALLARSHQRSAEELRTAQSLADVDTHLAKAVELHKGLVADFPSVLGYRFFLARSLVQLAEVQQARHEPAQARASLEEAIANSQKIQQSSPAMPMMKMMLAMQYASLAKVLRELGENALADEAAAKAGSVGSHHGPPPFGRSRQEGEGPATTP